MLMSSLKKEDSNWPYLPDDLLNNVLDRLVAASDYVRFAAVCNPWLTAARLHHKEWLESSPRQCPMLLVPNKESMNHSLYTLENNTLVLTNSKLYVPYYRHMSCLGYLKGWLIFTRLDKFAPMLFNPFTWATIHLPLIKGLGLFRNMNPNYYIRVSLSEDPSLCANTYQVLAFETLNPYIIWLFSSTSDSWVQVQRPHGLIIYAIKDTIYYRGNFYITCENHQVFRVEADDSSAILRKLEFLQNYPSFEYRWMNKEYLAESCNGRLLYIKSFVDKDYIISRFSVYEVKINHDDGGTISLMCTKLQNLGGETLFLGFSCSMSVLAAEQSGCRPDCIYYTDGRFDTDVGVYDIVGGGWGKCHQSERPSSRVLWIVPQANFNTTSAAL